MFEKMFVSNDLDLALSVICLIIAFSSACLISCFYCLYRSCSHSKSVPSAPFEETNGIANHNFNWSPHYAEQMATAPPLAPVQAMSDLEVPYIPRAKVLPPPPSYEQSLGELYANPQYRQQYPQYPQSQTRFWRNAVIRQSIAQSWVIRSPNDCVSHKLRKIIE